jgi:ABC-type oligopeptide transport system substrate-binding subunit
MLNCAPGSVFSDVRVRQALNVGIDRDGLCTMLIYPPDNPLFV